MYQVTNPATGEVVETFETLTDEQAVDVVRRSDAAFGSWRRLPVAERAAVLGRAGKLFKERIDELADIICQEMGKRPAEGKGELKLVASIFTYYAENAEAMLADEAYPVRGGEAVIEKRPLGALIGIMPWNFPYYQVARFAAPNLALGNTVLLKPSPSCPKSSAAIAQLLTDAGLPEDVFQSIHATDDQIATMIADPRIHGVSLTGSERAGSAVAAIAGKNLKKVVLELGGSDPFVVLDTDDVDRLTDVAVGARMMNSGQACNAPKRMIVVGDLYDEFVERLVTKVAALVPGDPSEEGTTLAPLSSAGAADRLMAQLDTAAAQGATVRTGGQRVDRPGSFVAATVLTDVTPEMDAYSEELFGPVAVVYRVETEEEAVLLANDTPFGLGAAVFSADAERARRVGDQLDVGMVYINTPGGTQADVPFGGVKRSGLGRELGALGIEEFMNKRVVRA